MNFSTVLLKFTLCCVIKVIKSFNRSKAFKKREYAVIYGTFTTHDFEHQNEV